jgi:DNA-binding GntR family transcriptional regulator
MMHAPAKHSAIEPAADTVRGMSSMGDTPAPGLPAAVVDQPVLAEFEAYRHILQRIRHGELEPGARVRTESIATEIGLSRQPVREAIRRLEAEGYLTSRPNRGAMVSKYTSDELLELFEIRAALESLAARIASARLPPEGLAVLEAMLAAMSNAGNDAGTWLERHTAFHLHLAGLANRPRLVQEVARLHGALEPYMRLWFVHAGLPMDAHDDHEQILTALRSGYPKHAEEVMHDHVLATAQQIIANLPPL